MNNKKIIASLLLAGLASKVMAGEAVTYTDWTSASAPGLSASATGSMNLSSGTVNVSYSGEFAFAQVNNSGTQFWTQPDAPTSLPYTGNAIVGNAPSTSDIIALSEPSGVELDTITFSKPVLNPIMLINSLGQPGLGVSYVFNQSFTLLSAGTGYWGGNADGSSLVKSGNTLTGYEGTGAIEIPGEVSTISWYTGGQYGNEYWNGFTIGAVTQQATGVPDGGTTLALLGAGFSALLGLKRKK
jgi:VPDSG-CTERM motif